MNKKQLSVLHLASFEGNIGDNANHLGAKKLFEKYLNYSFNFKHIEIREFYRKRRFFDQSFIDEMNSYDLVIIGGGNYFELWPQNSRSGTSIDLGVGELKKVNVPMIFYSLGVDVGQGVPDDNKVKFREFLKYMESRPDQFFVSVRNDGAIENVRHLYGREFDNLIKKIPDGGFFSSFSKNETFRQSGERLIGINIAGDMLTKRFPKGEDQFVGEFSTAIDVMLALSPDLKIIFFNHIPKDFLLTSRLLNTIKDENARSRVLIAPYMQGDEGARQIFGLYAACDLILANRFHANVIPISMGVPTLGLANYIQIENLYKDLGLTENLVDISHEGFQTNLMRTVSRLLSRNEKDVNQFRNAMNKIEAEAAEAFMHLAEWLGKETQFTKSFQRI
jgi:polysaccharide pyruvyl transferase WcaK-like protein